MKYQGNSEAFKTISSNQRNCGHHHGNVIPMQISDLELKDNKGLAKHIFSSSVDHNFIIFSEFSFFDNFSPIF